MGDDGDLICRFENCDLYKDPKVLSLNGARMYDLKNLTKAFLLNQFVRYSIVPLKPPSFLWVLNAAVVSNDFVLIKDGI